MISRLLLLSFVFLTYFTGESQVWTSVDENNIQLRQSGVREIIPLKYHTQRFDNSLAKSILNEAPEEKEVLSKASPYAFTLPMPDGKLSDFIIWKSDVMEEGLMAKYPSIRSYKGYQKNNPNVTARFSVGPNGFHAAIRSSEGMIYIDPYSTADDEHYIVYYTSDHVDDSLRDRVLCGTDETTFVHGRTPKWGTAGQLADKMEFRKYRLALACTGEWGAVRGTKEKALADMVVFVDRANVVFEAELALRAVLIARNDELIFLDGTTDPYTNPNQGLSILGQNTAILNGRVGGGSYEIGHVFSICFDVGGVAGGNICTPGKGAGVTCHNSSAISSGIVLVFNHEVGHQMTASHTFNKCGDTDQLALGTAYEPGSGSTIMAYPGACGTDNLGAPRDDYYHVASLEQMLGFTNSSSSDAYNCAEKIDINNFIPVIKMPYKDGFSIPKETPFFLKASATDENNDKLTYNWDQFDNQTSSPLGFPTGNAPIFRSLKPTSNPARYFPNVSRILNGQFTDKSELLPTYGRDLTFRFVVRDNNPLGTAATWEEMKFKVAGNAGPFKITFPVLDYKLKIGDPLKVTWDVANTNNAPVNCKFVDIYLAYNNSLDFDSDNLVLVAKAVPNDGEETIVIPNRVSTRARIVIKATDNIFLTTSLYNSRVDAPETPSFFMDIAEPSKKVCLPQSVSFDISTVGFAGLQDKIRFEVISGLPVGAIPVFRKEEISAGESNVLDVDLTKVKGTADYEVLVRSFVPGVDTVERVLRLGLTSTDLDYTLLDSPANGLNGVGPTQKYIWEQKEDAVTYELEVATSPAFKAEDVVIRRVTSENTFSSNTFLEKATIYFWRVRAANACKEGLWSETYAFNTEALSCTVVKSGELTINISQSGTPKVEAKLNVFSEGPLSDINVKNIRGDHQWSGDIVAYLTAPSGKETLLWSRKCGSSKGFNVGLDDQSNEFFQCPINTGKIYRPETPLAAFNGEEMKGAWTLRLEDRASGNGGRLQNFDLELCANIVLSPPFLTKNETLKIKIKESRDIDRTLLLSEDKDNGPGELKYSLVSAPSKGLITVNNIPAVAGSIFTQADIDQNRIKYVHTAESDEDDYFRFIVSDGQGGWISITDFVIEVEDTASNVENQEKSPERLLVYPNPAYDVLNVHMLDKVAGLSKAGIMDMTGRTLKTYSFSENIAALDIQDLPSGVYVLALSTGKKTMYNKFVKK